MAIETPRLKPHPSHETKAQWMGHPENLGAIDWVVREGEPPAAVV